MAENDAPLDAPERGSWVSRFSVPGMDCPSEEQLIRLALREVPGVVALGFDLEQRQLRVFHDGSVQPIAVAMTQLGLGATLLSTSSSIGRSQGLDPATTESPAREGRMLRWLLAINAVMFVFELVTGWLAQSTGLIADSLDMFADAGVYAVALYAVGHDAWHQLRAARLSGWLQLALALGAIAEVLRRLVLGSEPEPSLMMSVALAALAANLACLVLIFRHRHRGAHMRASWIFSTNDVLANLGVIAAGMLVARTGSRIPDLVIGSLIALLVLHGAWRILRLRS